MSADSLTRKCILNMLEYYESCAGALRMTLELLDSGARSQKEETGAGILRKALEMDSARVAKRTKASQPKWTRRKRIPKQDVADRLAAMSTKTPKPWGKGASTLTAHGYLKRVSGGHDPKSGHYTGTSLYLRTDKPYIVK